MPAKAQAERGMSLIEVAMALSLLALIAVMLLGSVTILSRRDVLAVDTRARANALATRYLETQRAKMRVTSLKAPLDPVSASEPLGGVTYTVNVAFIPGSVQNGFFEQKAEIPKDAHGDPLHYAAVKVTVTVSWPVGQTIVRECILVPRLN